MSEKAKNIETIMLSKKVLEAINFKQLTEEALAKFENYEEMLSFGGFSYETNKEEKANPEMDKHLFVISYILKSLNLLPASKHEGETMRICGGGTCFHGICGNVGRLTDCDSGCTYLG